MRNRTFVILVSFFIVAAIVSFYFMEHSHNVEKTIVYNETTSVTSVAPSNKGVYDAFIYGTLALALVVTIYFYARRYGKRI
jgi:predicted secreted protein